MKTSEVARSLAPTDDDEVGNHCVRVGFQDRDDIAAAAAGDFLPRFWPHTGACRRDPSARAAISGDAKQEPEAFASPSSWQRRPCGEDMKGTRSGRVHE